MSQHAAKADLIDRLPRFFGTYYRDAIGELAQRFPNDQASLFVEFDDLYRFDPDLADDMLDEPATIHELLEEALTLYDLPVDVDLSEAHVRVKGLPEDHSFYPGEFSPTEEAGHYRAIRGEVSKATDPYAKIVDAAFECQRCGMITMVPTTGDFQEPHECQGCERSGPFTINFDRSEFIDAQQLRVQTPPEVADGTTEIDVFVEDDLADVAMIGDRITATGIIHLEQQGSGNEMTGKFDPWLEAHHLELDETDHRDMAVTAEGRERIRSLAAGDEGDPLDVAAASLAPKVYGYDHIKRMIVLAMVGGSRTEYPDGSFDRGEFNLLLLGDPGTAKSKLIQRAEQLGWRTVGVSGKGATVAGVTATATQDDFGDGDWTLKAGAFVKANDGVVCIDELDDMPEAVRDAMSEPMSKQTIHITKAGINTHLQTRTAVVAAANPTHGRFDPHTKMQEEIDLSANLQQRFDLIYVLTDRPDEERDEALARHILDSRDAAKRWDRGEELTADEAATIEPPVDAEILRKWIGLAKQQPPPPFGCDAVKEGIRERFTELRGLHGHGEDAPVPIAWRKLPGIVRIAEAAARFEFSDTIEERHAEIALDAVGRSLADFGKDEDGNLDADIVETGQSKSQRERMQSVQQHIVDLAGEHDRGDGVPRDAVIDSLDGTVAAETVEYTLDKMLREGMLSEPTNGHVRWLGWT